MINFIDFCSEAYGVPPIKFKTDEKGNIIKNPKTGLPIAIHTYPEGMKARPSKTPSPLGISLPDFVALSPEQQKKVLELKKAEMDAKKRTEDEISALPPEQQLRGASLPGFKSEKKERPTVTYTKYQWIQTHPGIKPYYDIMQQKFIEEKEEGYWEEKTVTNANYCRIYNKKSKPGQRTLDVEIPGDKANVMVFLGQPEQEGIPFPVYIKAKSEDQRIMKFEFYHPKWKALMEKVFGEIPEHLKFKGFGGGAGGSGSDSGNPKVLSQGSGALAQKQAQPTIHTLTMDQILAEIERRKRTGLK